MLTYNSKIVKAIPCTNKGSREPEYYSSLSLCARAYGMRYESRVLDLIEQGGLAPDGRTFFDWPTDQEMEDIQKGKILIIRKLDNMCNKKELKGICAHCALCEDSNGEWLCIATSCFVANYEPVKECDQYRSEIEPKRIR